MKIFYNLRKIVLVNLFLFFSLFPAFSEKVSVAVFNGAEPVVFTNEEGVASGFFPSLIPELLPNDEIEYITDLTFNEAKEKVKNGEIDLLPAFIKTEERRKYYNFNKEPIMVSWSVLFVESNTNFKSIVDLRNKKIALMKGDQNGKSFIRYMNEFDIKFIPVYFDTFKNMKEAVINKKVYGMVAFNTLFKTEKNIKPTDIVFAPTQGFIASGKMLSPHIMKKIDDNIKKMKNDQNSTYYKLVDKWLLSNTIETYPSWLNNLIKIVVSIVLLTIFTIIVLNIHLKKICRDYEKQKKYSNIIEKKFSLFVENTHDLVMTVDSKLNFTFMNKNCLNYFKTRQSKIIGSSTKDFVLKKKCTDLFIVLMNAINGKHCQEIISVGDKDSLIISATPIVENNEVIGVLCFGKRINLKEEESSLYTNNLKLYNL